MLSWLTVVVVIGATVLGLTAAVYALTSRLVDDRLLLVVGLLEVALIAQTIAGLVNGVGRTTDFERPVFFAYLLTVPFVAPFATFLALKEKTRWSMAVVVGSSAVVGVLVGRLVQIWNDGA